MAIVVLNYNGLADTVPCLESLRRLSSPPFQVLLVDNGSEIDPSAESRQAYPGLEIILTGQNLGYAGGNNRGMERALEAGADYILVLNNDTVVAPDIVERLLAVFQRDPRLGALGPVVNYMDEPDAVMTDGVAFNPGPGTEFFRRIEVPVDPANPPLIPVDIVNGCCLMLSARALRDVGLFDERMFIVHEESDLCLRLKRAGFGCAVLGLSLVWHKGSSAFERSGRRLQRYFDARNLCYLVGRHAGRLPGGRSWTPSFLHYLLYTFYRFDVEHDAGKPEAANAVIEGVYDALRHREGPYVSRSRPGIGLVRGAYRIGQRLARARRSAA